MIIDTINMRMLSIAVCDNLCIRPQTVRLKTGGGWRGGGGGGGGENFSPLSNHSSYAPPPPHPTLSAHTIRHISQKSAQVSVGSEQCFECVNYTLHMCI